MVAVALTFVIRLALCTTHCQEASRLCEREAPLCRAGVLPEGTEEKPKHLSNIAASVRLCREPSSAAAVRSESSRLI